MKFMPYKKTKSDEKVIITIRLDIKKLEKIDALAQRIDISRNELINQCITYALNQNITDNRK